MTEAFLFGPNVYKTVKSEWQEEVMHKGEVYEITRRREGGSNRIYLHGHKKEDSK